MRLARFMGMAGAAVVALALAILWLWQPGAVVRMQDRVFDAMLRATPAAVSPVPVVVVDFGAVDEAGAPWGRDAMARLVGVIGAAGPAVIVHDVVYSGDCGSVAALSGAMGGVAQVLSALPAPMAGGQAPAGPVALGQGVAAGLIVAPGAEMPCAALREGGARVGSGALIGEGDAAIRRVPMVVIAEGAPLPALALAAVADGTMPLLVSDGPGRGLLRAGDRVWPVDGVGRLRLDPAPVEDWAARTFDAVDVLDGAVAAERFAGAIVLIGSSLPQRGGLRPTAAAPLTPSVQIQADLVATMLAGVVPDRPAGAARAEAAAILIGGVLAAVAFARLAPLIALGVTGVVCVLWAGGAVAVFAGWRVLVDPAGPVVVVALVAAGALGARAVASARAERRLRDKLGQLLPPAVVARLAGDPRLFRLEGEMREVTALFTDIEGFSVTARDLGPVDLVRMLDRYFDRVCGIVLRHGGMVDKIVGDSVHAFFNAPLDQPGHAEAALACAREIVAETEALRRDLPALGRTRIGVETGPVVLGDVGSAGRIDYTAHGDAVNLAARLQEANKVTGTQVCVGPGTARAVSSGLIPLGEVEIRSFGAVTLYTLTA